MAAKLVEITREFGFEAAHCLPDLPQGHPYTRLHGHSFRVEVTLAGTPDPRMGWILDFAELDRLIEALRERLDHRTLNEVAGLEQPTLENIANWIFDRIEAQIPGLDRVTVRRDSVGERCTVRRAG
ncbi:MAG TPA: 6-carboxytetrahydropterin synthase QueD [Stellaceae bacterium]|nr:6-carboxytetrahydropterin synthase QueD [Stellaceae bacterium]